MRPRTQKRAVSVEKFVGERGDRLVIIQFTALTEARSVAQV